MYSGATSARYSGAVKDAMPMAMPSTTREAISVSGDHAMPDSSEPMTNSTAPSTSERLRPRWPDSQLAARAPAAAPNIMELTIHSMVWSLTLYSAWMNWVAPEITPTSRPNMRPANAASTQTKTTVALDCVEDDAMAWAFMGKAPPLAMVWPLWAWVGRDPYAAAMTCGGGPGKRGSGNPPKSECTANKAPAYGWLASAASSRPSRALVM